MNRVYNLIFDLVKRRGKFFLATALVVTDDVVGKVPRQFNSF